MRVATTRSSTSSTSTNVAHLVGDAGDLDRIDQFGRARHGGNGVDCGFRTLGHGSLSSCAAPTSSHEPVDSVRSAPLLDLVHHDGGRPGVGEGGGADLHGDAPASSSSTASTPGPRPPTPTMGRSGSAACTSCTARTATGWIAGPDRPPPPPPSTGPAGLGVDGHAHDRVDEGDRLGAGLGCGGGDGRQVGDVGAELGPRGRPHRRRLERLGGGRGEWANMRLRAWCWGTTR
jgi:hypothetical protein